MSKFEYAWWCFVVAAFFGGTWGGLLFWFNETLGLVVGTSLCLFAWVLLINLDNEEEDLPQHNRRFNDL
jgi:hypothetical protein